MEFRRTCRRHGLDNYCDGGFFVFNEATGVRIRYTTDILYAKPDNPGAGAFLSKAKWRETSADLGVLFNLFRLGHAIHIADKEETDAFILDLDHLTPEQADRVHSTGFLDEVKALFDAEEVILHDSASRQYNKQKVFVRKHYRRRLREGNDRAYLRFCLMFKKAFGIQCDICMRHWWQLTWPCRDPDAAYSPETMAAMDISHPVEKQPLKEEVYGEIGRANTEKRKKSPKSPPISAKMPKSGRGIPLFQDAVNAEFTKEARPDIYRLDFFPYFYKKGRERASLFVPIGERHPTVMRVVAAAVYFAHYLNIRHSAGYTMDDSIWTVSKVVERHFADATAFWDEEGAGIMATIEAEWAECSADFQEYGRRKSTVIHGKIKTGYNPRSHQAAAIWKIYRDELLAMLPCLVPLKIKELCYGVKADMDAVYRMWRAETRKLGQVRKQGRQPGTTDSKAEDLDALVATLSRNEKGRILAPGRLKHSPKFRKYAKDHGLKCSWTK